ncbi:hypothetical protein ABZP36_031171 [Zizania latifolia]
MASSCLASQAAAAVPRVRARVVACSAGGTRGNGDGGGGGRSGFLPAGPKAAGGFACGVLAALAVASAPSPVIAASQRLPPLSTEPNRCERAFVGNTIGQANGVYDKPLDLRFCDYTNKKTNLKGKSLAAALMSDAKFDGADMSEVVMSKAYAVGASFKATLYSAIVCLFAKLQLTANILLHPWLAPVALLPCMHAYTLSSSMLTPTRAEINLVRRVRTGTGTRTPADVSHVPAFSIRWSSQARASQALTPAVSYATPARRRPLLSRAVCRRPAPCTASPLSCAAPWQVAAVAPARVPSRTSPSSRAAPPRAAAAASSAVAPFRFGPSQAVAPRAVRRRPRRPAPSAATAVRCHRRRIEKTNTWLASAVVLIPAPCGDPPHQIYFLQGHSITIDRHGRVGHGDAY